MALTAAKIANNPILTHRTTVNGTNGRVEPVYLGSKCALTAKLRSLNEHFSCPKAKSQSFREYSLLCWSRRPNETETETKEFTRSCVDGSDFSRQDNASSKTGDAKSEQLMHGRNIDSRLGLAEACRFIYNDAKFVNERARNDIFLLSRGIRRLDARARQDVAILGTQFLKLDARAREDTGKIDKNMKRKAERLHQIATILTNKAESKIKTAADRHWNDGALEADLRLADFRAKQRAMEDALMALEFVKNVHDLMVSKMYTFPLGSIEDAISSDDVMGRVMLEKNGKNLDFFPGDVSSDRISAIQEAYWSMASALSEADGIDYTDPEELELLIMTLIDLDAMDGKSSVTLLAECSSSPDDNTRKALANALSTAPSMWTLGNAGMGALQRLAEDSNPAIASAASRAINELKNQWEIVEGDSWRFMVNQEPFKETDQNDDDDSV